MKDAFPLIIIEPHQTFSIPMLSVISALHHVPLFIDGFGCATVPVETEVDLQLLQTRCVVDSDSIRDERVKKCVRCIKFDGSSAKVTLFSSRKIILFLERFWQKFVNVIQQTRFYLSIYWAAICFPFSDQPCALQYILRLINVSTTVTW